MEPLNPRKPSNTNLSSGNVKIESRRRIWTTEEEEALINALKELITTGWKCDNGFRTGYLLCLEKALGNAFPGAGIRADPHISSKLRVWKKNYGSLYQMLGSSGFGWNDESKMISVDNEDIWKTYIRTDPAAEKIRGRIWPQYPQWCEIFGKDRATGETSEDHNTADKDQLNLHDVGSEGNKDKDDMIHGEENDFISVCQPASSSTGKKAKSKRKRQVDTDEKLVELMETYCEQNKSGLGEFTKKIGVDYDLQTQRKTVYEALGEIGGLTVGQKVRVAKLLVNNSQELDLFFSLPTEARVEMVHQMLDDI